MPQFYRAAARMLQNAEDSEDALQNGLLSAFLHLDQFQGRSSLSTWVHSIVTNAARCICGKRSRLRTTSIADDIANEDGRRPDDVLIDSKPSPEEECAREEQSRMLRERMEESVARLPVRRSDVHYRGIAATRSCSRSWEFPRGRSKLAFIVPARCWRGSYRYSSSWGRDRGSSRPKACLRGERARKPSLKSEKSAAVSAIAISRSWRGDPWT